MIDKEFYCEEFSKEDLHKLDGLKAAIKKQEAREFMPIIDNPISLRDQFAMVAMQGDWANQNSEVGYFADCNDEQLVNSAKIYYRMADAMLKARDK